MKLINKFKLLFIIFLGLIIAYNAWYFYPIKDISNSANTKIIKKQGSINYKLFYFAKSFIDPSFEHKTYTANSNVKLDIVVPLVEKDLEIAKYSIDSVRKMVMHPIGKVYIIAPESEKIRQFAKEKNCEYLLEDTVIPNFTQIKKQGGWFVQQFIKLSADKITEQENILVLDADTIFLRPQIFITTRGKHILSILCNPDYVRKVFVLEALNIKKQWVFDFVAHHILMNRKILQEMKADIESIHKKSWDIVLFDLAKKHQMSFSEYELYASYALDRYPHKHKILASANMLIYRNRVNSMLEMFAAYAGSHKSLSTHHHFLFEE